MREEAEVDNEYRIYVGVDWATQAHQTCVLDSSGHLLAERVFAHAGEALDRGFHVVVFPEGRRSAEGALASFRPGIGLLVKESYAAVLPMALRGMGDLKTGRRSWFRSGTLEVRVGQPIRFAASESEAAITARLHSEVEKLLTS